MAAFSLSKRMLSAVWLCAGFWCAVVEPVSAQQPSFQTDIQPLLSLLCYDCHQGDQAEADVDLQQFESIDQIRQQTKLWQRVSDMLGSRQMPPKDALQPTDRQQSVITDWLRNFLREEAAAHAGDPGPVTLRRLSNAEYTYTLRDLTGIDSLDPAREFPVDGAAGEGFTNAGDALGMSPALVTKYLDAAKQISAQAVLLPDGAQFSQFTSRRDWTDEGLQRIRQFYDRFVDTSGTYLDWERQNEDSDRSGRIPLNSYIQATLQHRDALRSGQLSLADVGTNAGLNVKYLSLLWNLLGDDQDRGFLLNRLRKQWQTATTAESEAIVQEINRWQHAVWQFHSIGHIGRKGASKRWMTPTDPFTVRQQLRLDLPASSDPAEFSIYLTATQVAGDDTVVAWRKPTLHVDGMTPILLRDVSGAIDQLTHTRNQFHSKLPAYLLAASQVRAGTSPDQAARAYQLNGPLLNRWLSYLGIAGTQSVVVQGHFSETIRDVGGYSFVSGWGSPATPSIVANASDQQVRIPGIARPHSIIVHPSPELFAAVGWQSPIDGAIEIDAQVADAHPECGNGIEWFLLHRNGGGSANIDHGQIATGGNKSLTGIRIETRKGDLLSLVIGPKAGEHSCDLTSVDLSIAELDGEHRKWNLAADVSGHLLDRNPQSDSYQNDSVWHFYQGRVVDVGAESGQLSIPAGCLLAKWQQETDAGKRQLLADQIQTLVQGSVPQQPSADRTLYQQLQRVVGIESVGSLQIPPDPRFGQRPESKDRPDTDFFAQAPNTTEFRIPAEFAGGGAFYVDVELASGSGEQAVQVSASLTKPESSSMLPEQPILIGAGESSRAVLSSALDQFRDLFPAALCYTKIVPVDEVVTLQLYYREDDQLKRLMCDDLQAAELDRLWDELLYVAQEPIAAEVTLEQLQQFATQDRPDLAVEFDELKPEYRDRAEQFRDRLIETEPRHLDFVVEFAGRAWRRGLSASEQDRLRTAYDRLRQQAISHDQAIRLLIARVLVAPAFLYRLEQPGDGHDAVDVTDHELATRLSYFFWSSTPDQTLRDLADSAALGDSQMILEQSRRMLTDPKIRRMAIHFACQWLHLRDFDQTVEKNERIYPEFAQIRGDMYEEVVRFFADMFANDGSILDLISADHTFVNQRLAQHYGIADISGSQWQRIEGMRQRGRGGVLGMATVLASQSGASRTSPILRGNWVYETLLGERLPRPPAGIPQLPEVVPEGKTARQLIEQHSAAPQCVKCHQKIDPYGFALEQFDTIGRMRPSKVLTTTTLADGQSIDGLDGLRRYLSEQRRDDIVYQFCKKLLGYALGREVQLSDEPLLQQMQQQLQANGYRLTVAVESIVTSRQFRQIRGRLAAGDVLE